MAKFLGRFRHTLDHKGRVAIPARFRRALPPESHDTFIGIVRNDGSEKYLALYSSDDFDERFADVAAQSGRLAHVRQLKRAYYSNLSDFQIDPQGRITIPLDVKKSLGMSKDVLFIGVEDTVEVWAPEKFEAHMRESEGLSKLEYRVFDKERVEDGA
jgi:MraZ protein